MDLRRFVTLKTVVEEGSFVRAAAKLCCTQSTVTFHIQQLEQELSVRLFEKIGRRMRLTEMGRRLMPHVHELARALDKVRQAAHEGEALAGELHVVMGETLLAYKMPPVLERFKKMAPQVRLRLSACNCYVIRDTLLAGEADLGVFYRVGQDAALHMQALGDFELVLVASPLLEEVNFNREHQRIQTSFIINEAQCVFRQIFENTLRLRDINFDNTIELWSIESIKQCVAGNLGVSFLPRFAVERELLSGQLRELPFECSPSCVSAVCAHHAGKCVSPAMALFMELLRECV